MDFLSIGECMAELAPTDTAGDYRLGFAGDTFNTAWYLARIAPDMHVGFYTTVGTDAISQKLTDAIAASGIDNSHVRALENETAGLYLISLVDGERSFSYWRSQSAARKLAQNEGALAAAIGAASIIYFSGITLAILDATSRATLLTALKAARDGGKTIAFDPNLRRRLWASDREMTETIMQGASVSDIALPSFDDEASWFHDRDPAATANRYVDAGVSTVIVKNGSGDITFRDGSNSGTVAVPPVSPIVDTTAAGDSFNAAIFAGIHQKIALADAISNACRLAGHVVQGKGALVDINPAH